MGSFCAGVSFGGGVDSLAVVDGFAAGVCDAMNSENSNIAAITVTTTFILIIPPVSYFNNPLR
jgi:hypothetical protein